MFFKKLKPLVVAMATAGILLSLSPTNANAQTPVKNIVLVHGAFADGSGYQALYNVLVKRGYHVSVVGNPNTGLAEDAAATKRVLDRQDGAAILVGHSYGGAIITEVGTHEKVAGLVYLAAFAPDQNEPLIKLLQAAPSNPEAGILPPQDGFIWYDKAKFHSGFCADVPQATADFMFDSQVPVSATVFGYNIAQPAWKSKPVWYVVATEDKTIPPDAERFMATRMKAKITEIKSSHVVMMSHPDEVADVIEKAAKAGK